MTLPLGTVVSLRPTFIPYQRVSLAVKIPFTLHSRANLRTTRGNFCMPLLSFRRPTPIEIVYQRLSLVLQVLTQGSLHLHIHVYFTKTFSEIVPNRYAFHAGRNLPDKEFCYLRIIIVTDGVHRGFGR
uniref:Uncharacterized protein n=1 Tax=Solanum lycopersicum TaxID=4081 RepID=K4AWG3_SOLLC